MDRQLRLLVRVSKLIFFFICFTAISYGQTKYKTVQIEVLDKIEKKYKRLGGERESISISLIKKSEKQEDKYSSLTVVNIEIQSTETSEIISSSGLTITSNLDFAINASTSSLISLKKGSVFFCKLELDQIKYFLNETIKQKGIKQDNDIGWALEIDERFKIAMIYEKQSLQNWKYFMELDGAKFEIPFEEGFQMMKDLLKMAEKI